MSRALNNVNLLQLQSPLHWTQRHAHNAWTPPEGMQAPGLLLLLVHKLTRQRCMLTSKLPVVVSARWNAFRKAGLNVFLFEAEATKSLLSAGKATAKYNKCLRVLLPACCG
jgi:hypothetical protein